MSNELFLYWTNLAALQPVQLRYWLGKGQGNVMQCNNDKFREAYAAQVASRALYKK